MIWEPLNDQILVAPLVATDRTAGGILTPEAHRERPQMGIVLAVGGDSQRKEWQAFVDRTGGETIAAATRTGVGDLVAFGKYAGVEFELPDGQEALLMREIEALVRVKAGTFELVTHEKSGRTLRHLPTWRCDDCPQEPASEIIAEERARVVAGNGHLSPAEKSRLIDEFGRQIPVERG